MRSGGLLLIINWTILRANGSGKWWVPSTIGTNGPTEVYMI